MYVRVGPLRDGSPKRTVDEATDSSKNEKHGDGGRTLEKEKERLEGLESDVKNAKTRKGAVKDKNQKGEEHGRTGR
ncbi:hypothetical protein K6V25_12245 [Bacteroides salyersiae]|nr:hypothetical protein [Bacteroides salyersiae]RHF03573.1 hypothetical protein DW702_10730 [Bacteroides salyersiae]UBD67199.1 hypothetical protein K6V25_12245 [Bacteroides salyersiae]